MNHPVSPEFPTVIFDQNVLLERHDLSALELIQLAAKGESDVQADYLHRWKSGAPAPYLTGFFYFRGRYFHISSDAYITDPEATYLVDVVKQVGTSLLHQQHPGYMPTVVEFGIGAGTLAISVALDCPRLRMCGFDLDPAALEVARKNQALHGTQVEIFESDFFKSWPHASPPDLVFADPPWGSREDLYDDERSAEYYDRMPPLSAYPKNGRIGLHEGILCAVKELEWKCPVVMNLGVIPETVYAPLLQQFQRFKLYQPTPSQRIVVGYVN